MIKHEPFNVDISWNQVDSMSFINTMLDQESQLHDCYVVNTVSCVRWYSVQRGQVTGLQRYSADGTVRCYVLK